MSTSPVIAPSDYPSLRLLDMADELDRTRLRFLLSGRYHIDGLDRLDRPTYLRAFRAEIHPSAQAILSLVSPDNPRGLRANTVLVEHNYVDRDTYMAYLEVHARAFRDFPRRTVRLHFFRNLVKLENLLDEAATRSSYLGFCVLPPSKSGPIGRTVLPPPEGYMTFVPGQSSFSANLAGVSVKPEGVAYIEQDGRIAACATAAMWMSTMTITKHLGLDISNRSMAEITALAMSNSVPDQGSGGPPGLTTQQILWGLRGMGYEALVYTPLQAASVREGLYSYAHSGIAPILLLGFPGTHDWHAVSVVGYMFNERSASQHALIDWTSPSSLWHSRFLVHDDHIGPYVPVTIEEATAATEEKPGVQAWVEESYLYQNVSTVTDWYHGAWVEAIIVPMPSRHATGFEEAIEKASIVMDAVRELFPSVDALLPETPLIRARFVASNEYKRRMHPTQAPGLSPALAVCYRASDYPRYIWVVEWCIQENSRARDKSLHVIADVVIDPTSSMRFHEFVTLHIPRLFFRMPAREISLTKALANPLFVPDDAPYQTQW